MDSSRANFTIFYVMRGKAVTGVKYSDFGLLGYDAIFRVKL